VSFLSQGKSGGFSARKLHGKKEKRIVGVAAIEQLAKKI
jgi:hypothetical protein